MEEFERWLHMRKRQLCPIAGTALEGRRSEEFDYALVDAPPCLEFADARSGARYAERLMLVAQAGHTDSQSAQTAVQPLLLDEIPVMDEIFNRWDPAHNDPHSYARYRQDLA